MRFARRAAVSLLVFITTTTTVHLVAARESSSPSRATRAGRVSAQAGNKKPSTKRGARPKPATKGSSAHGPSDEARARALARHAMDVAFESGKADVARSELERALELCDGGKCSTSMRAELRRDLAVCDEAIGADDEAIVEGFRGALREDDSVTLEAHRRTDRLSRLFEQAKRPDEAPAEASAKPSNESSKSTEEPSAPDAERESEPSSSKGARKRAAQDPPRRFWIGVEGSFDVTFISSADDVCKLRDGLPMNDAGYFCTHDDGADYPDRLVPAANDAIRAGELGSVAGGPTVGNVRVKLSFDLALDTHWLIGARVGFVTNVYPGSAVANSILGPLTVEARATRLFGRQPYLEKETSPYVYLGVGLAETSASVGVDVVETPATVRHVKAWQVGGDFFASVGVGARYAVSSRVGFLAGPRLSFAFGSARVMPTLAPELALQVGF